MIIIALDVYEVVRTKDKLLKFMIRKDCIEELRKYIGADVIMLHGYVRRHILMLNSKPVHKVILIPRIRYFINAIQITSVVLPEFLLPRCRYTTKAFAALVLKIELVFSSATPNDAEYDKLVDDFENEHKRQQYLKSRYHKFLEAYEKLKEFWGSFMSNYEVKINSPKLHKLLDVFYIFDKFNNPISPLLYKVWGGG